MPSAAEVPQFHELLWPTLRALVAIGGSGTIQEIDAKVAELADLSDEQVSVLHGAGPATEFAYRSAWARSYLKRVEAVENSARGVWAITSTGRQLSEDEVRGVPARVRAMTPAVPRTRRRRDETRLDGAEPDIRPEDWKQQLLSALLAISADAFERLAQRLLGEAGFATVVVTGRIGDGGIDGTGTLIVENLLSFPIFFSVQAVPRKCRPVRSAGLSRCDGRPWRQGTPRHDRNVHARGRARSRTFWSAAN